MGIPQLSFPGLDRWDLETTRSVSDIAALFAVPLVVRWSVKWLKTEEFGGRFFSICSVEESVEVLERKHKSF